MSKRAQRVDLHVHSFFSDGVLLPSELMGRAVAKEHRALAITDHADTSNMEQLAESLLRFVEEQGDDWPCRIVPGIELTHVAPGRIGLLAERAKGLGLSLVVVHGETIVEPVAPGTNEAAVECPFVDILAHPGFITLRSQAGRPKRRASGDHRSPWPLPDQRARGVGCSADRGAAGAEYGCPHAGRSAGSSFCPEGCCRCRTHPS